jgi:hypothetical protein
MVILKAHMIGVKGQSRLDIQCDYCNSPYVCTRDSIKRTMKAELHFCSKQCVSNSHKDGVLRKKREEIFI